MHLCGRPNQGERLLTGAFRLPFSPQSQTSPLRHRVYRRVSENQRVLHVSPSEEVVKEQSPGEFPLAGTGRGTHSFPAQFRPVLANSLAEPAPFPRSFGQVPARFSVSVCSIFDHFVPGMVSRRRRNGTQLGRESKGLSWSILGMGHPGREGADGGATALAICGQAVLA